MKLSIWDKLSLNVTGRLPKSTQAKVDAQLKKEQDELKAKLAKAPIDRDGDGKVFDGTKNEKPAAKKATPKKQAELKAKPKPAAKPAAKKAETPRKPAGKSATAKKNTKKK